MMSQADPSRLLRLWMAAWLCGCTLAACSPPPADTETSRSSRGSTVPAPESSRAQLAPPILVRGYFESRDGGLFTACGETSRRRVRSIEKSTSAALEKAEASTPGPLFLIAEGDLIDRDQISIAAFNLVTGDAWSCESPLEGFVLEARGNDILWSLEMTPAAVSFRAAPDSPPVLFAYRSLTATSGSFAFDASDGNNTIVIRISRESCSERMTGTIFGESAKVTFNDQTFDGCAWRGASSP